MQGKKFFTKMVIGFVFFLMLNWSCEQEQKKIIHYSFNNVTVSRYDDKKKTYLYMGYCKSIESIRKHVSIIIDWEFDDFLLASMIFHKNGTVELISGGGGEFKKVGTQTLMFFKEYTPAQYTKIVEQFSTPEGNKNLCELSDNLDLERKKTKIIRAI